MSNETLAFFTGLFGSIHCVGMCGPLAFSVPSWSDTKWLLVFDKLVYQFGRVISYAFLGLLIGLLGKQLWILGLQQSLSIISGVVIILVGLSQLFSFTIIKSLPFFNPIKKALQYAYKHRANHLMIGILNGFLPCGFVYLALLGALNTGTSFDAANYMFWFGLGTIPLMLVATLGAGFVRPYFKKLNTKIVPYLLILLGIWFILRGISMNIPYLSPAKSTTNSTCN